MSKVIITSQKLVDLADAVRTHNSISDKLTLSQMKELRESSNPTPGAYDKDGKLMRGWADLISNEYIYVNGGVLTTTSSDTPIVPSYYPLAMGAKIVIPPTIASIGDYAFDAGHWYAFEEVIIPNSVTDISPTAFYNQPWGDRTLKIYYKGSASGYPWGAKGANTVLITDF